MALDLSMPILVVDDYQTMVRIIRNLLKQGTFNISDWHFAIDLDLHPVAH